MMNAIIETFFLCLVASMIWAPIVFLAVARFAHKEGQGVADKLWPSALVVAALPAMFAPFAAAFGLSLRNPAPLPPLPEIETSADVTAAVSAEPVIAHGTTFNLASILEAAAVLYFYGFLMFLALGAIRMIWFSCQVRYAFDIDEPALEAGLEDWRRRMGIKRRPRYAFCGAVSSVCVHGFFRPVILMPMCLLDRVPVEDAILMGAHEMAHIRRGDTWLFALCTAMKAVFWFNPFMQRIAARANLAAEQAADALVIARGAERRQYAHCFVQGLRFAAGASPLGKELVPSFTPFDKRSRRERLDAILSKTGAAPALSLSHKLGLGLSIVIAAGLAFAQAALAVAPKPAKEALPVAPIEGDVTMAFGAKSDVLNSDSPTHLGVDIRAARGAVVRAAGDGKVVAATRRYHDQPAWGKVVVIDHGNGLVTRYAHLDSYVVRKGDMVDAGDVIGAVGSTGKATGPHLHFEVIRDGVPIDPTPVLAINAPAPKPVIKSSRAVVIAPTPETAAVAEPAAPADIAVAPEPPTPAPKAPREPAPEAAPAPEAPPAPESLGERLEQTLAGKFEKFGERVGEAFQDLDVDFEDFNDVNVDFDNFDLGDLKFDGFDKFAMNTFADARGAKWMSEEDRQRVKEARREAMKNARAAMEDARKAAERAARDGERARARAERDAERALARAEQERERAQERAERDREQAQQDREQAERDRERAQRDRKRAARDKERARQRAEEQAERERERAEREQERAEEQAERERERAQEEAERELERAQDEVERAMASAEAAAEREWEKAENEGRKINKHELLALREKALKKAQADLDRELESIKAEREALNRETRKTKND